METYVVWFECSVCGAHVYPSRYSSRAEARKTHVFSIPPLNPSEDMLLELIDPGELGLSRGASPSNIARALKNLDPAARQRILTRARNKYENYRLLVASRARDEANKLYKELSTKASKVSINETTEYIEVIEERYASIVEETQNTIIYRCPRCGSELAVVTLPQL